MEHKTNLVMLPTEDETNIKLDSDGVRLWYDDTPMSTEIHKHQHLYITVSQDVEPIKEGDYALYICEDGSLGCTAPMLVESKMLKDTSYKKIIATTDPKLNSSEMKSMYDGGGFFMGTILTNRNIVPKVQQSFLEEFVANPDGEYVVEYTDECKSNPQYCEWSQCRVSGECSNAKTTDILYPKVTLGNEMILTLVEDNWININDRKPTMDDCGTKFLCLVKKTNYFNEYEIAEWFNPLIEGDVAKFDHELPHFLIEYKDYSQVVTHWRPLPELPENI